MPGRTMQVLRYVLIDLAGSVAYFPAWWYTVGIIRVLDAFRRTLVFRWQSFGLGLWIRNFFVPMYGAYDWSGRLISVLVRFAVIIGRLIILAVETVFYLALSIAWLLAPPFFLLLFLTNFFRGAF